MLDTTDPQAAARARRSTQALARIVRGRAINPRFIAGQMRHGPRGAAEFAETVDRLVDFAETTGAVSSALFDLRARRLSRRPARARFPDARKPGRRARHRRAARGGAAARPVASAPQRSSSERLAAARGGGGAMSASASRRGACPGLVGADGRPATACWRGSCPPVADPARGVRRALRGGAHARQRHRWRSPRAAASRSAGSTPSSAPLFAAAVGMRSASMSATACRCSTDPLPGDPTALIDANALAAELRKAIADRPRCALAPKVSVVDRRRRAHCISMRLRRTSGCAPSRQRRPMLHVALAGDAATATPLGAVALEARGRCRAAPACNSRRDGAAVAHARVLRARRIDAFRLPSVTGLVVDTPAPRRSSRRRSGWHSSVSRTVAMRWASGLPSAMPRPRRSVALDRHRRVRRSALLGAAGARTASLLLGPFTRTTTRDAERRGATARLHRGSRRSAPPRRGLRRRAGLRVGLIAARAIAAEIARRAA